MSDLDKTLARRALLKALTAGAGVVVANLVLPGTWSKSKLQFGLLPAHACATPGVADPLPCPADMTATPADMTTATPADMTQGPDLAMTPPTQVIITPSYGSVARGGGDGGIYQQCTTTAIWGNLPDFGDTDLGVTRLDVTNQATWTTSDPNLAIVTSGGLVYASNTTDMAGDNNYQATITATYLGVSGTAMFYGT